MDTLQDVFEGATTIEENAIHFSVFFPTVSDLNTMIDRVQELLAMIRSLIQPYTNNYLWQKDQFHLVMVHDESKDPSYPYVHGITRFGDCIHDEWFIVFLLRLITEKIPDTVATLYDNDGDVLLIEAAMHLPEWLDPSNSQHRVGLYQGQVHIIPMPRTPADLIQVPATELTQTRAIDIIRNPRIETLAEKSIQESIQARQVTQDERHHAKCTLPSHAAFVLLQQPQLLPLAVEAFYLRDPIGLKACSKMQQFPPIDSVTTTITFTKTTYAQTVSQKFYPPKPFRLPPPSNKRSFAMAELGMKVACGLEMLYHQQQEQSINNDNRDVSEDPKYKQFLARLTRLGYFRQERPGSKLYRALEQQAQQQYRELRSDIDDPETFSGSQLFSNPHQTIDDILSNYSEKSLDELLKANPDIQDSDDWMHVDPQQLEDLLNQRMGQMQSGVMADIEREINNEQEQEPNVDLDKMMSQFEKFIEGSKSGLDGVNFPGEEEDDDGDESENDDEYEGDEDVDASLSFDTERFMNILTSVLGPTPAVYDPLVSKQHQQHTIPKKEQGDDDEEGEDIIKQMDEEIYAQDKITASFAKENEDEDAPVDINLNLVKNILESYKSQQGLPGPAGNILGQFGIVLPADQEEEEEEEPTHDNKNVHKK
ncbi:SGT1 protein-domain-containing protein [Phascolomyces articulosus]|uniref:SGT1 protein-domain-containing protein n=1 Tax=Phascolomyces articulosus TaxID=60185 RepID=A0AAD5K8A8_9FUNG|nr:SGT1 protein-domain-containing protein [Phascolomyces articulosus]